MMLHCSLLTEVHNNKKELLLSYWKLLHLSLSLSLSLLCVFKFYFSTENIVDCFTFLWRMRSIDYPSSFEERDLSLLCTKCLFSEFVHPCSSSSWNLKNGLFFFFLSSVFGPRTLFFGLLGDFGLFWSLRWPRRKSQRIHWDLRWREMVKRWTRNAFLWTILKVLFTLTIINKLKLIPFNTFYEDIGS